MKKKFLIAIYYFLSCIPLQSVSKETGFLYQWKLNEKEVWKKFGDEGTHNKYNGEIKYGKPHGLGIKVFLDGRKYMGTWKNGEKHGNGTLIFPDGLKLKGKWRDNKPWNVKKFDLKGRTNDEFINGVKQKNNKIEGVLFFRKNNDSFGWYKKGDEKKDYKYVGQIENGKPNGWGKFSYPSGYIIEGQFKEGKVHGKGKFFFTDGKTGIGQFRDGRPWNIKEFDNQSKILGGYVDGIFKAETKKVGILFTRKEKGIWIWFENDKEPYSGKYEGQIENGKPDGHGSLILINGTKYTGAFKKGEWHGKGIFFFPDGQKWEGEFKEDMPWNIKWFNKSGKILTKWENGIKNHDKQ